MKKFIVLFLCLLIFPLCKAQSLVENSSTLTNNTIRYKPLRIAVSIGLGLKHTTLSDQLYDDEDIELAFGYPIEADIDYYFNDYLGCGITMSTFNVEGVSVPFLVHNTNTLFIGPVFASRFFNHSKKNRFNINFSIGYLGYTDNYHEYDRPSKHIKFNTIGILTAFGYDIGLNKDFGIGFQFSFLLGGITKDGNYEYPYYSTYGRQNLSRLSLTIGLRLNP